MMATARVAVTRGKAASRESSPANSRSGSRRGSRDHSPVGSRHSLNCGPREFVNTENVQDTPSISHPLDNQSTLIKTALLNANKQHLSPSHEESPVSGNSRWYGSNGNITSSDSTPSSENTNDSGAGNEPSPLTEPASPIDFSGDIGNNNTCLYRMPIVGYEVMEDRSRFTVFKIQVFHQPTGDHWFVFRRYTDFIRLNKKLRSGFPGLRFALPPKKWFGDNFDPIFLEDRQIGLQAFIDNIIGHAKIREKKCVRNFFCLDDPPGAHDTLEESRAMCQSLEETVADLHERLREKDSEILIQQSRINFLMAQQETLVKALRLECELHENQNEEGAASTHDLNMALLKICEKTLNGNLNNINLQSAHRNGDQSMSEDSSSSRKSNRRSVVESPMRRALERVFIPQNNSQLNAPVPNLSIQNNNRSTTTISSGNPSQS